MKFRDALIPVCFILAVANMLGAAHFGGPGIGYAVTGLMFFGYFLHLLNLE